MVPTRSEITRELIVDFIFIIQKLFDSGIKSKQELLVCQIIKFTQAMRLAKPDKHIEKQKGNELVGKRIDCLSKTNHYFKFIVLVFARFVVLNITNKKSDR